MNADETRQLTTRLQLIYGGLIAAVLIYVAVAWLAVAQGNVQAQPLPDLLVAVLVGLAGADLLAGPAIRQILLKQVDGSGGEIPGPEAGMKIQRAYVAGAAVTEAAAVFGLILTFLSGRVVWTVVLSAAVVVALLASWPSRSKVRSLLGIPGMPLEP
jgi:hypothetical protein